MLDLEIRWRPEKIFNADSWLQLPSLIIDFVILTKFDGSKGRDFMQFFWEGGEIGKIVCWHPSPDDLVAPLQGNPGSVTDYMGHMDIRKCNEIFFVN